MRTDGHRESNVAFYDEVEDVPWKFSLEIDIARAGYAGGGSA